MLPTDAVSSDQKNLSQNIILISIVSIFIICILLFLLNFFDTVHIYTVIPPLSNLPRLGILRPDPTPLSLTAQRNLIYKNLPIVLKPAYLPVATSLPSELTIQPVGSVMSWKAIGNASEKIIPIKGTFQFIDNQLSTTTLRFSIATKESFEQSTFTKIFTNIFTIPTPTSWKCNQLGDKNTCLAEASYKGLRLAFVTYTIHALPQRIFVQFCTLYPGNPHYNDSNFCLL